MVSSRCLDHFPAVGAIDLSDVRRRLKDRIEKVKLFGQQLISVWINEDAPPAPGEEGWDACMQQVDRCDILLVLYNGNAGWTAQAGGVGICHGEFQHAYEKAPGKVYPIQLGSTADIKGHSETADARFQAYVETANLFRGSAKTETELLAVAEETLLHAIAGLVELGGREARRGRYYFGEALEWSKLDYAHREAVICGVIRNALVEDGASAVDERLIAQNVGSEQVLFKIHAVPASLTVSSARELVGRPFLKDHELIDQLEDRAGPVYLIGCNRTVTETQAASVLGFPDAIIVAGPFGVYVADEVQKIQFVLLANCRDESLTRISLQRFSLWLSQSGEGARVAERARARSRIAKAVAAEQRLEVPSK
jgi:hypothetical protein